MKNKMLILVVILSVFMLVGCNKSSAKSQNKIVNENGIVSLKIFNIKAESKDIKNKPETTKILELINSIKIVESDVIGKIGMGYSVNIIYSNDKIENLTFLESSMLHNEKWYEIDKNIVDELRNIYDKN